jgi:predicted membrane-bound mannosyltransferase
MKKRLLPVILLTALTVACIHKTGGTISAWERVNVNMAALAQINNDVAKGLIAAEQSGLVSTQQAAPILNYQELVAKDHAAMENILATGSDQAANQSAKIQALLTEIQNQGTTLIQSGGLGIKNPKSQQTFTQDLQAIVNLTQTVLEDFQLVKGN